MYRGAPTNGSSAQARSSAQPMHREQAGNPPCRRVGEHDAADQTTREVVADVDYARRPPVSLSRRLTKHPSPIAGRRTCPGTRHAASYRHGKTGKISSGHRQMPARAAQSAGRVPIWGRSDTANASSDRGGTRDRRTRPASPRLSGARRGK